MDAAIDSSVDAALADERSVCGPPDGVVGQWTRVLGALNAGSAIWGSGECDVWIASWSADDFGDGGKLGGELAHWDGFSLSKVAQPWPATTFLFGSSARDVWALGSSPSARIERWDGLSWAVPVPMLDSAYPLTGGWATTPTQAWVVASNWLPLPPSDGRCRGGIVAWDGQTWTGQPAAPGYETCPLAMWGASPSDVWAVGLRVRKPGGQGATCDHWDGQQWHFAGSSDPGTALFAQHPPFLAVHGSSSTNAWAVGIGDVWDMGINGSGLARWDGQSWSLVPNPVFPGPCMGSHTCDLSGVWVAGPDDAWAVGVSGAFRWDGKTWAIHTASVAPLRAVWGASPTSVWAVGDGAILHYTGTPN